MSSSRIRIAVTSVLSAAALGLMTDVTVAAWGVNLPSPVSPIGRDILELHNLILLICLIIFVVVFSFMFYSLYAHRKSKGHEAAQFSHSNTAEVVWTIIPFLILIGMAIPSTATLINMEDTSKADLTVKITGYQWKWQYEYPEHGIGFYSTLSTPRAQIEGIEPKGENYLLEVDKPLVIPTNKKVRFLLTANDVIHSWWIPKFGTKKDAIPGFINEMWTLVEEPGTYRGQCTELCGKDHGFMPVVVEAKSPEEFEAWLAREKESQAKDTADAATQWSKQELLVHGAKVYANCVACHGADGKGLPGAFPAIAGSPVATGPVAEHVSLVLNGKNGTAMQPFKNQLSDLDIAAVVTYQRNALGNSTGDIVQPDQVSSVR
jgi:cytochrome c oxidase subunit 2